MTNENFFKHDDKAYAENLNDAILIANAFNYQVPVNIPEMYNNNHYPNDNNIHKVGVADVTIVTSGSLSIGDTAITNNSNTSQILRLRIYPNFNSFYSWKDISWTATGEISIDICDAGTTTSLLPAGELTNPDGSNLSGVASLRGLKEYDLLITIPANGILNTLSIVFINNWNSQNRVSASISAANVDGLDDIIESIDESIDEITTSLDSKVDKVTGKGLSSNDFTDEYKELLDNIPIANVTLHWGSQAGGNGYYKIVGISSFILQEDFKVAGGSQGVLPAGTSMAFDCMENNVSVPLPDGLIDLIKNRYSSLTFSHSDISLSITGNGDNRELVIKNNGSSNISYWSVEYSQ